MSTYTKCPNGDCGHEASGGLFGGAYIPLHKCKAHGHVFCNSCKNGDRCPICSTDSVWWNWGKAFTKR